MRANTFVVKIDEKKDHHPIYHLGNIYDAMILFKPASNKHHKDSHQFSCKILVLNYLGFKQINRIDLNIQQFSNFTFGSNTF